MQGLTSNSGVKAFFMIPARLANAVKVNSRVLRIHKIEEKAYMPKGLFIWRLSHVLVLAAYVHGTYEKVSGESARITRWIRCSVWRWNSRTKLSLEKSVSGRCRALSAKLFSPEAAVRQIVAALDG